MKTANAPNSVLIKAENRESPLSLHHKKSKTIAFLWFRSIMLTEFTTQNVLFVWVLQITQADHSRIIKKEETEQRDHRLRRTLAFIFFMLKMNCLKHFSEEEKSFYIIYKVKTAKAHIVFYTKIEFLKKEYHKSTIFWCIRLIRTVWHVSDLCSKKVLFPYL